MAYTIKKGQDIRAISKATGLSLSQLKALNPEAFKGSKQAVNYAGTVLRTKSGDKFYSALKPTAPIDPRAAIADPLLKNVVVPKSFQDVITQEQWNTPFDEWTRNYVKNYMEPEWKTNVYEPAVKEYQKQLEQMNKTIGLQGRMSGSQNQQLAGAGEQAIKDEAQLRQGFQDQTAALREQIKSSWSNPLYESQMKRYSDAPWRDQATGITGVQNELSKTFGNMGSVYGTSNPQSIQNLIANLGKGTQGNTVPVPTYDWTAKGINTDVFNQYKQPTQATQPIQPVQPTTLSSQYNI